MAQGIWVPGVTDPVPDRIELPPVTGGRGAASSTVTPGGVVVSARDVTVEHRSRQLGGESRTTTAVAGADLDVHAGELLALVGPSGAGKSSLLTALGGLAEPAAGSVDVAPALAADRADADRRLGRPTVDWPGSSPGCPQRAATAIVGRTVRDEVLTTPLALGRDRADAATRVDALLDRLGLAHLAGTDPRHLSGGEQRRLAVASALAHGPALLLADEPTVGQDRLTWSAVMGCVAAARAEGTAVVVTTHDPGVTARADRTVALEAPAAGPGADRPRAAPARRAGQPARPAPRRALRPAAAGAARVVAPGPVRAVGRARARARRAARPRCGTGPHGATARGGASGSHRPGSPSSAWPGRRGCSAAATSRSRPGPPCACCASSSRRPSSSASSTPSGSVTTSPSGVHLPPRPVVAATAALQRLQSLHRLWNELMTTRRVRGIRADHGIVPRAREAVTVTVGLLIGALGQAATLALAMDARGFAEARQRTWAGAGPVAARRLPRPRAPGCSSSSPVSWRAPSCPAEPVEGRRHAARHEPGDTAAPGEPAQQSGHNDRRCEPTRASPPARPPADRRWPAALAAAAAAAHPRRLRAAEPAHRRWPVDGQRPRAADDPAARHRRADGQPVGGRGGRPLRRLPGARRHDVQPRAAARGPSPAPCATPTGSPTTSPWRSPSSGPPT